MRTACRIISLFAVAASVASAQTHLGDAANDVAGSTFWLLRPAGDFDHDGTPDVVVGAPGFARVYSGATHLPIQTLDSGPSPSLFNISTPDGIGDVDGDGFDDVVVGQPNVQPAGAVRVYSGQTGLPLIEVFGAPSQILGGIVFLGFDVAAIGDADADGTPDFATTRHSLNAPEPHSVYVYSGGTGLILQAFDLPPSQTFSQVANSSRAGDVDGDGHADVLFSYYSNPNFDSCASIVELRSGFDGSLLRELEDPNLCTDGSGLAGGADLDGDGVPDQLVGTPFGSWTNSGNPIGTVVGYSGATGARIFVREGFDPSGGFGNAISIAGDLNGDGEVEIVCGEPSVPTAAGNDGGVVHVFSGGSGPRFDVMLEGTAPGVRFGAAVAGPGDLDQDGIVDLAILSSEASAIPETFGAISFDSVAKAPLAADRFVLGSTLLGAIGSGDSDDARFEALKGMKLTLEVKVIAGDLAPVIEITSADGEFAKKWSPKGDGKHVKKYLLDRDGEYVLAIRGAAGSTGDYRIETARTLPKSVKQGFVVDAKSKNGKPPEVVFRALAGTVVTGSVEPISAPLVSPALELVAPSGAVVDLTPFADSASFPDETWVEGIRLTTTGKHRIRIADIGATPNQAHFVFDANTPRGAERIEID